MEVPDGKQEVDLIPTSPAENLSQVQSMSPDITHQVTAQSEVQANIEVKPAAEEVKPSAEEIARENANLAAEFKSKSFDYEVRTLIKACHDMLSEYYRMEIETSGTEPLALRFLTKYGKVFQSRKSIPSDHYADYENFYNTYRASILSTVSNDTWLRTGKPVFLQYGSGVEALKNNEAIKQVVIRISDIYRIALLIKKQTEDQMQEADLSVPGSINGKDLIWNRIILLHLLRIFYYLQTDSDKEALGRLVTELETELGIKDYTVNKKPKKITSGTPSGAGAGLHKLFGVATSFMEKMGMKIPDEAKLPDEDALENVINNVFNSPQTQGMIDSLTSVVKDSKDVNDIFGKLRDNITDPNARAAMDTLGATMKNLNIPSDFSQPANGAPSGPQGMEQNPTFSPKHSE